MFGVGVGIRVGGFTPTGGAAPYVGLLDTYPGASAAYSVRLLKSTYTGSAIRVRRSSDNAEQDIGFSSGNLDTSALTSFCGAGNGFVTTWYDQSGNTRNATQGTAAKQPQIVSSGSVLTENSKPTLQFDGINDTMSFNGTLLNTAISHTNFITYRLRNGIAVDNLILTLKNNSNDLLYFMGGIALPAYQDFVIGSIGSAWTPFEYDGIAINEFKLLTDFYNGGGVSSASNFSRYANNVLKTNNSSLTFGGTNKTDNWIASWGDFLFTPLNMSELIIYSSNQSSNVSGIDTNIINYYAL